MCETHPWEHVTETSCAVRGWAGHTLAFLFRPLSGSEPGLGHKQAAALESQMFFSSLSLHRGLITFENKSYVLEPMDNVTDRYKLFAAEALKGVWGSCGSHPSASGPTAGGGHPPPSRTRVRRGGGRAEGVILGTLGPSERHPVLGHLRAFSTGVVAGDRLAGLPGGGRVCGRSPSRHGYLQPPPVGEGPCPRLSAAPLREVPRGGSWRPVCFAVGCLR